MAEQRKSQILEAATECFSKYGYKKTTLEDIGQIIGLNKASIYYYFKNKEEIFTTIILEQLEQFLIDLQSKLAEVEHCFDKIETYFVEKLGFWSTQSNLISQITEMDPTQLDHIIGSGEQIYTRIETDEHRFISGILRGCSEFEHLPQDQIDQSVSMIFALTDGIKERYMRFSKLQLPKATNYETLVSDTRKALRIFMHGMTHFPEDYS